MEGMTPTPHPLSPEEVQAIRERWERAQDALTLGFGTGAGVDDARDTYLRWALARAPIDIKSLLSADAAHRARVAELEAFKQEAMRLMQSIELELLEHEESESWDLTSDCFRDMQEEIWEFINTHKDRARQARGG